jgi:hypothetical protein
MMTKDKLTLVKIFIVLYDYFIIQYGDRNR